MITNYANKKNTKKITPQFLPPKGKYVLNVLRQIIPYFNKTQ